MMALQLLFRLQNTGGPKLANVMRTCKCVHKLSVLKLKPNVVVE
jgi:hypothetical protein